MPSLTELLGQNAEQQESSGDFWSTFRVRAAQPPVTPTGLPPLNAETSSGDDPRFAAEYRRLLAEGKPDNPYTAIEANANLYGPNANYERSIQEAAKERGILGQTKDALLAGESRMAASALDLIPGVAESLGYRSSKDWQDTLQQRFQREADIGNRIAQDSALPFATETLFAASGSIGQMIPTFGAGAAGLGYKAVLGVMTGTVWPDFYQQGKRKYGTAGAATYATIQSGITLLTTLLGGKLAGTLGAKTFEEIAASAPVQGISRKLIGWATEGVEEVSEDTLQKITDYVSGLDPDAFKGYTRQEAMSFIIGTVLGFASEVNPAIGEFVDRRSRSAAKKLDLPPTMPLSERNAVADAAQAAMDYQQGTAQALDATSTTMPEGETDALEIQSTTQPDAVSRSGEINLGPAEGGPGVLESGQESGQVPRQVQEEVSEPGPGEFGYGVLEESERLSTTPTQPVEAVQPEQTTEPVPPAEPAPQAQPEPVAAPEGELTGEEDFSLDDVDFNTATIDPLGAARQRRRDAEQAKIDKLESNRLESVIADLEKRGDPDKLIPDLRAMPLRDASDLIDIAEKSALERNSQRKSILREWDTTLGKRKRLGQVIRKEWKINQNIDLDFIGKKYGIPYDEIINDVLQDKYNPELTRLANELGDGDLEVGLFQLMLGDRKALTERFKPAKAADTLLDAVVEYSQKTGFVPPDTPDGTPGEFDGDRNPNWTSPRNAWMDMDRAGFNLEALPPAQRRTWGEAMDSALSRGLDKRAMEIASNILQTPRELTDIEQAGLLRKAAELKNRHSQLRTQLKATTDAVAQDDIQSQMGQIESEFDVLSKAFRLAGTESGRNLAARKMTLDQDYDLVSVLSRARRKKGGPLSRREESRLKKAVDDLEKKQQEMADPVAKAADAVVKEAEKLERELETLEMDPALKRYVGKLAKFFVANGIPSRRALVDAVQKEVRKIFPDVRRRQVMDAISGYGNFTAVTTDEIKLRLGDLKRQLLQIAKLKDMAEGKAPKPTGKLRAAPSQEERELIKEVNEDKKTLPVSAEAQATRLKTALDTIKTRLKNQIADLAKQIKTREKLIQERKATPSDDEVVRLREERDALKAQFDEIFGKPELTDAQRLERAKQAVERQIEEYERRFVENDYAETKRTPLPDDPVLQERREYLAGLQALYKETDPNEGPRARARFLAAMEKRLDKRIATLKQEIDTREQRGKSAKVPPTTPALERKRAEVKDLEQLKLEIFGKKQISDAKRLEMAMKATQRSVDEYERRLREGDFSPPQRRVLPPSAEYDALSAERDRLAKEYRERNPDSPDIVAKRKRLNELLAHIANDTLPAPKEDRTAKNELRATLDDALKWARKTLRMSEPWMRKVAQERVDRLKARLDAADFKAANRRGPAIYESVDRLNYEAKLIQREISRFVAELEPRSIGSYLVEPFNVARSLMTSMDWSAVFNQGGLLVFSNLPKAAAKLPTMFRATFSDRVAKQIHEEILSRPNAHLYDQARLYLADFDGKPSAHEELYRNNLIHKLPILRNVVAGSERSFTTFLNLLRADTFDAKIASLPDGRGTAKQRQQIATFINVATGRGSFGKTIDPALTALGPIFFAPRYTASRFQLLLGQPLYGPVVSAIKAKAGVEGESSDVAKIIAATYGKALLGVSAVYLLAYLALGDDMEVETDPKSTDFAKIRMGDTRLDPLFGLSQTTVLLSRMISGETLDPQTGMYKDYDRIAGTGRFLRMKLSPLFAVAADIMAGETVVGEDVTLKSIATGLTVPLSMRDLLNAMEDQGIPRGTALSILAIFGMRLQTY